MRHFGHIGDHCTARYIFAQRQFQFATLGLEFIALHHVAHRHHCNRRIGNLDANHRTARHGRFDPNRRRSQCQRQIVVQAGNLIDFHADSWLQGELRHRWAGVGFDDSRLDLERSQRFLDDAGFFALFFIANQAFGERIQHRERRQRPRPMIVGIVGFHHQFFGDSGFGGGFWFGGQLGGFGVVDRLAGYNWRRRNFLAARRTLDRLRFAVEQTGLRRPFGNRR